MLTILRPTTTNQWLPSGNPIIYTLTENSYLGDNLMALITVYVNDEAVTKLKYPLVVNENLYVDVHDVINNALHSTFVNNATQMVAPASEWCSYKIGVREQYFDTQGREHITGEATTPVNYSWYAVAPREFEQNIPAFIKEFEPTATHLMFPLGARCVTTEFPSVWLNRTVRGFNPKCIRKCYTLKSVTPQTETFCYNDGTTRYANYFVVYVFTREKPYTMRKKFIFNITDMPNTQAWKFASVPVGVQALNNIQWTQVVKMSEEDESIINPETDGFYVVSFASAVFDGLTRIDTPVSAFTLFAIDNCHDDEFRILYKSTFGGWWQVRTHRKHYKENSYKSSVMTNRFYQTPSVDMRYRKAVGVKAESKLTLNTDWLQQWEVDEIEDMLLSPDIWIIRNGVYIPATLTDADYQISEVKQDKLVSYTFTFDIDAPNTLR